MRWNPEDFSLTPVPPGSIVNRAITPQEVPTGEALVPRASLDLMASGNFNFVRVPAGQLWVVKPVVSETLSRLLTRSGLADPSKWYDAFAACGLSANLYVMDYRGERYKVMDVEIDPGDETGVLVLQHIGRRSREGFMRVDIHDGYGKMLPFVVYKEQRRNPFCTCDH